ncbi:hypothetical protein HPB48_018172 [Haemaphysalis longicornis]|uniref:Uncharacterized protein n=1 Tax=Haemaphysalis longicornis TaxID=44386 RepID=A0A9J6GL99_HAELO|nr:hypothetical protein HPB48_018172 [Haemaphysalis longicornis]
MRSPRCKTQHICTHQPFRSTFRQKNNEYVAEGPPKEPVLRLRSTLHLRRAPGRVRSLFQERQANINSASRVSREQLLETDGYGGTRTPLYRVSSSQFIPKLGPNIYANELWRATSYKDVHLKTSSDTCDVGGLSVDVDVSVSDDSQQQRRTKQRFDTNTLKTAKEEGRSKLESSSSKVSFRMIDRDGEAVLLSELSSSISENPLKDGTELQARSLELRPKGIRSQEDEPAVYSEPPSTICINRRHSRNNRESVRHVYRDRCIPRSQIRHYTRNTSLRDFGALVSGKRTRFVESACKFPTNVATAWKPQTVANQSHSRPWHRNPSRCVFVEVKQRPTERSNTGNVNVRARNRRLVRPGSPSHQRWRKHSNPTRDYQCHWMTPHPTTQLPLTRRQAATIVRRQRFENHSDASLSRPPLPVQSPFGQCTIRPPLYFEAMAMFNEPTLLDSCSWRPSLSQGSRPAQFVEGLSASKTADATAAEPDFPQQASPRQENNDTNEKPELSRFFQASLDAVNYQQSLASLKVIVPEAAGVAPSFLPTLSSGSSPSGHVKQPEPVGVQMTSTDLHLPGAELSWLTLSHHTEPVTAVDVHPTTALQQNDVTMPGIPFGRDFSSTYCSFTRQPGFLNDGEIEKHAAVAGSTDPIISTAENRLRREHVKTSFGRGVIVPLVIMACLSAVTAAGSTIRAWRQQVWEITENEDSAELPWLYSPHSNPGSATTVNRSCQSQLCRKHAEKLFGSLDANVHPCRNFYGHVCAPTSLNGTEEDQLAQQAALRVMSFLKDNNDAVGEVPMIVAARRLWHDCAQLGTIRRNDKAPLKALLNLTGLGAWPYKDNVTLPDVWKVAGNLQRLMALTPLVELKRLSNGTARLAPGNLAASDDAGDVLDAMRALHPNGLRFRELAADVAGFNRQLKSLSYRHLSSKSLERNDTEVLPRSYIEAVLIGLRLNISAVDIHQEPMIMPLVQFVHNSRPQTVLNMLGYRLVRHVDIFMPAAASDNRDHRCTRLILEDALTNDEAEYVRYAAVRDLLNFSSVRAVVAKVKDALEAKLSKQRWLDPRTRRSVRRHLREMKVLFLRLSAVELREPQSPLWPALQAARLGPRLCRCMLRLLLPSPTVHNVRAEVHWSPTVLTKLDHLRTCMRAQHSRQNKANQSGWGLEQEALAMVDNAALGPARDVFLAYLKNIIGKGPAALSTDEAARTSIEWDQADSSVLPKCEVTGRVRPNDDTEDKPAADKNDNLRESTGRRFTSGKGGKRRRITEDRTQDTETPNPPDVGFIHGALDALIVEFGSQGITKTPLLYFSPRPTSPKAPLLPRNAPPKMTQSSPLDVGGKHDRVSPTQTEIKRTAVRRWASATLQRPPSSDEAGNIISSTDETSDKQSSPYETSENKKDFARLLTACSALESVTTNLSNEARLFCESLSVLNSKRGGVMSSSVNVSGGTDDDAVNNLERRGKLTRKRSGHILRRKLKRSNKVKPMKKKWKIVNVKINESQSLSKMKKGNSNKAKKSLEVLLVPICKHNTISRKTREGAETNNIDDGETPLCERHDTMRSPRRKTQRLRTNLPFGSTLCQKNNEYVAERQPKEPVLRLRSTLHLRKAPGRLHSLVQDDPANMDRASRGSREQPLQTDDYGGTRTPLRASSSQSKPNVEPKICPNELWWAKAYKDSHLNTFSDASDVGGLCVDDVDVNVLNDSQHQRRTKQRFYSKISKTSNGEGRPKHESCCSKISFRKIDEDGEAVLLTELSSSISGNLLKDGTDIQARSHQLRPKLIRFQQDEPADYSIPPSASINRRHSRNSRESVRHCRDRCIPGSQIRHYTSNTSLGDFGTLVSGKRPRFVASARKFLANVATASKPHTVTNQRDSTPRQRNPPRSVFVDVKQRPTERTNTGNVNARDKSCCMVRPGSPSQQRSRKHSNSTRDFQHHLMTPHTIKPLPHTRRQAATIVRRRRFENHPYASFSRPPSPVQSPTGQCPIRPPVYFEAMAMFNEPTLLDSCSWRPSLPQGTLPAHFVEGLSASKTAEATAAEPDFPQQASPRSEKNDTNKKPELSRSFQASLNAAKQQQSLPSLKVIFPEAAGVPSSFLPTLSSASSCSEPFQQPDPVAVQMASSDLHLAGAELSRPTLSYHTESVTEFDANPTTGLQQNDVTAQGISFGCSSTHSSTHCSFTGQPGFQNERDIEKNAAEAGSMDPIICNAENRLRREHVKTSLARRVVLPLVVITACLSAVIAAGFAIRAWHHEPWEITENEEDSGEHPWFLSPHSNPEAATTANRSSCQSQLCWIHAGELFSSVDANVNPCRNFYGHVCAPNSVNGTREAQMDQQADLKVMSFLKDNSNNGDGEVPVVVSARHLWHACVKLNTVRWKDAAPLKALLNLTGLGAWPYKDNVSLPDVWKIAGNLQRLMALAPLVELKRLSNGTARLAPGNLDASDDAGDVLDAMRVLHPNGSRLHDLAEDVAGFNRHLKSLRFRHLSFKSLERNDTEVLPRSYLEAVLIGLRSNISTVEIQQEPLIMPLVQFAQDSRPQTVLNMLGYRLVRHVDLFMPAAADDTRSESSFLYERYQTSSKMKPASRRSERPSEALAMYQRLRESRFHTGLLQGAAYDGEGDHDCAYDNHKKSPLWPALQAARLGPRLCRCMLRLLLPSPRVHNVRADVHWSPMVHTKLDHLRACMRAQHSRQNKANQSGWGPELEVLAMADNAALGPARDVFHAYVENLVNKGPMALSTDEAARSSIEWDQVCKVDGLCKLLVSIATSDSPLLDEKGTPLSALMISRASGRLSRNCSNYTAIPS